MTYAEYIKEQKTKEDKEYTFEQFVKEYYGMDLFNITAEMEREARRVYNKIMGEEN